MGVLEILMEIGIGIRNKFGIQQTIVAEVEALFKLAIDASQRFNPESSIPKLMILPQMPWRKMNCQSKVVRGWKT